VVRLSSLLVLFAAMALTASASSVWDLVSSSPRPRKSSRQPSVLEKGYAVRPNPGVVTNVVEKPVEVEKIVTVERPVTNTVEVVRVEKVEIEKPVTNVVERIVEVERPVTSVVERVVEKPVEVEKVVEVVKVEKVEVEKPVTNLIERTVVRQVTNVVEKTVVQQVTNVVEKVVEVEKPVIVERQVTNVVEKIVEVEKPVIVERTNVVEKLLYDHGVEMRLAKDKEELERRSGELEAQKGELERRNEELTRELARERGSRERLERAGSGVTKKAKSGRPARITSTSTYYDRKKGVALFEGRVHVDDEDYQLHADKAFVFTSGTNDVRRIVAVGHVAMTNEARRVYGDKVSYYRQNGMVVLYAGNGVNAEIRDESKAEDQTVIGSKIKFWVGSEQVEVLDATISAPTSGIDVNAIRR